MNKSILFLAMSMILLTSCSKNLTYFSDDLQNENNWNESDLKRIQFYVSQDIVLYKSSSTDGQSQIEDGKIRINDKRRVNEVVIKRGTPGTLIFSPKDDRFAVSFDNDDNKYLMFGPSKKNRGRYTLLAKNWRRSNGVITYGNEEYRTNSNSAYAALMVDIKKASSSSYNKQTASGRKVK